MITGYDPADARQRGQTPPVDAYHAAFSTGASDLAVGVLLEAFECDADDDVGRAVRAAIDEFESMGAAVTEISVPAAARGDRLWTAIAAEAIAASFRTCGAPVGTKRWTDPHLADELGRARVEAGEEFPVPRKALLVAGEYLSREHHARYTWPRANVQRELTQACDETFADVDVPSLPTKDSTAPKLADHHVRDDVVSVLGGVDESDSIRSQFNATGHPALSVPCGTSGGPLVGLQLVAPRFDEATLLRAGPRSRLPSTGMN